MNLPIIVLIWFLTVAGAAGISYGKGYHNGNEAGKATIQQKWDAERKKQDEEYRKQVLEAKQNTLAAQARADKLQKEKNDAYKTIAARDTALRNSLRNRPERPAESSGVPTDTGACTAASGAELARGDGEFLSGYSTDAAKLQKDFDTCITQYNEIKQRFNKD